MSFLGGYTTERNTSVSAALVGGQMRFDTYTGSGGLAIRWCGLGGWFLSRGRGG